MNKKIIIAIILIIVLILLVFLFIRLGKNLENQPDQNMDEIETTEAIIEEDDLEIDIPEDYLSVEKDNITSSTSMKAYAVAYNYNEEKDLTLVNVYLKNNSNSNISKDAVAVISLNDENGNLTARFGGIIEKDEDVLPGESLIVKTQFYGDPGEVASAIVDFENMNVEENIIE